MKKMLKVIFKINFEVVGYILNSFFLHEIETLENPIMFVSRINHIQFLYSYGRLKEIYLFIDV